MRKLTFFKGGVHPPHLKEPQAHNSVIRLAPPQKAKVPLSQHIGAPAEAIVAAGDDVVAGQLIGAAKGFISANIHAPIAGKITGFEEQYLPNGVKSRCVMIDGEEAPPIPKQPNEPGDWRGKSQKELLSLIEDAGVVGMGGATFPSHVKFTLPSGRSCDYLIVNASECEPCLASDHRMLVEESEAVVQGLAILAELIRPEKVVFGIEANKPDAYEIIQTKLSLSKITASEIETVLLKVKYPQGAEKNLIKAVTRREVPSGKLPLEVGCIVVNVGTLRAVQDAVVHEKPLIERNVTLAGGAVKNPGVYKVSLGMTIEAFIEEAGGLVEKPVKVINGGPMMGFSMYDLSTPITKGTSGILVLTEKEVLKRKETPCLSCGSCVRGCPMGLTASLLFKYIDNGRIDDAEKEGLMDCVECGCCAFGCPASIPLVHGLRLGKLHLRKRGSK